MIYITYFHTKANRYCDTMRHCTLYVLGIPVWSWSKVYYTRIQDGAKRTYYVFPKVETEDQKDWLR